MRFGDAGRLGSDALVEWRDAAQDLPFGDIIGHQVAAFSGEKDDVGFLDLVAHTLWQCKRVTNGSVDAVLDGAVVGQQQLERTWNVLDVGFGRIMQ